MHQLRNKISKQIEIDQLTGKTAIKLRASIISYQQSQKRLKTAHSAMLAGCVYLPACPTLKQAYEIQKKIEFGIQNIAKQNWNLQRINWQVYLPISSQKNILPSLDFFSEMKELEIKIQTENLISVSKVWKNRGSTSNDWKIAWIK